jgi:hypothetical protein
MRGEVRVENNQDMYDRLSVTRMSKPDHLDQREIVPQTLDQLNEWIIDRPRLRLQAAVLSQGEEYG